MRVWLVMAPYEQPLEIFANEDDANRYIEDEGYGGWFEAEPFEVHYDYPIR